MNRNYNSEKEKNYTKKKVDEKAVMYFLEKKKNTVLRHGSMIRPIWGGGGGRTPKEILTASCQSPLAYPGDLFVLDLRVSSG